MQKSPVSNHESADQNPPAASKPPAAAVANHEQSSLYDSLPDPLHSSGAVLTPAPDGSLVFKPQLPPAAAAGGDATVNSISHNHTQSSSLTMVPPQLGKREQSPAEDRKSPKSPKLEDSESKARESVIQAPSTSTSVSEIDSKDPLSNSVAAFYSEIKEEEDKAKAEELAKSEAEAEKVKKEENAAEENAAEKKEEAPSVVSSPAKVERPTVVMTHGKPAHLPGYPAMVAVPGYHHSLAAAHAALAARNVCEHYTEVSRNPAVK